MRSDGPANLGTFGTLPGIWNGLPAFANYTLDFGIDTLIAFLSLTLCVRRHQIDADRQTDRQTETD